MGLIVDDRRWSITPLDEDLPTPEQMEEGAAITRTYFMKGLWHWLPVWETIGEPWRYPSQHLSPYPIGHHLHRWPALEMQEGEPD